METCDIHEKKCDLRQIRINNLTRWYLAQADERNGKLHLKERPLLVGAQIIQNSSAKGE
jgi:hypothetical protein